MAYKVRGNGYEYEADTRGMREVLTSSEMSSVVEGAAEYGKTRLQAGGRGYEDIQVETFQMRVFGEQRACASLYNATPGGLAADAQQGLFSQVVSDIEALYS